MLGARAVAVGVMVSLVAPPASSTSTAQPTTPPTAEQQKKAGALVNEAIAKSASKKKDDLLAAVALYQQAYDLIPQPILLSNIGTAYALADQPVEALKFFCMYLSKEKDTASANFEYAKAQAKQLQTEKLGRKDITDDNVCAPKPEVKPVDIEPTPPPVDPPPEQPVEGGSPGKGLRLTGIIVGGAGALALIGGIYYGKKAKDASDLITNWPNGEPWPSNLPDIEKDGQRYENYQVGLLIAGSLLFVGGAAVYVVGQMRGRESSEKVAVRPSASPDGLGFVISGGF